MLLVDGKQVGVEAPIRGCIRVGLRVALVFVVAEEMNLVFHDRAAEGPADLLIRIGKHAFCNRIRGVELVVLAGFMRVLKAPALEAFPRRILNIHPSLLPKFPGLEAWKQALVAGESVTGCTVHYVDEKIDHGDVIAQREVRILPNDTPESLHARIQIAEHELYPTAINKVCRELSE